MLFHSEDLSPRLSVYIRDRGGKGERSAMLNQNLGFLQVMATDREVYNVIS